MVSEIKNVGAEFMPGMARAAPVGSGRVHTPADILSEGRPGEQVRARHAAFATLASVKDEAAYVALSVRHAGQSLAGAEATVQIMREKVQQFLKNFPPFPPGSEQRQAYLNSLNALRRQLEDMYIPPLEDGPEPIIYPRDRDLPNLDPMAATDEQIRAFGRALDAMAQSLGAGISKLEGLVKDLSAWLPQDWPRPPQNDGQALDASRVVASELHVHGAPLLGGRDALLQLVG